DACHHPAQSGTGSDQDGQSPGPPPNVLLSVATKSLWPPPRRRASAHPKGPWQGREGTCSPAGQATSCRGLNLQASPTSRRSPDRVGKPYASPCKEGEGVARKTPTDTRATPRS